MGVDEDAVQIALTWGSTTRQEEGRIFYMLDRRAVQQAEREDVDIHEHSGVGVVQADDGYIVTVTNYGEGTRSTKGSRRGNRKGRDQRRGNKRRGDTGRRPSHSPSAPPRKTRGTPAADAVSRLNNHAQRISRPIPSYTFTGPVEGFWVCVGRFEGTEVQASGTTMKTAKQSAATEMCTRLRL